jgi:hypothetical protein
LLTPGPDDARRAIFRESTGDPRPGGDTRDEGRAAGDDGTRRAVGPGMRIFSLAVALASASIACSGGSGGSGDGEPAGPAPGDDASPAEAAAGVDAAGGEPADASPPHDAGGATDAAAPHDAGAGHDAGHDAVAPHDAAPACKKQLTVVFAVGTGAGSVASLSNGCWTVIDADGAANPQYRKCSTSSFVVKNGGAPNYAYDDTNPSRPLSEDQNFLSQCASGATGVGFEYMANRGGWRLLTAPHMAAYFAELYTSDTTIADSYSLWQTPISGHTVSPMINIGPNDPATIDSAAQKMCARVDDKGYFGVYNGDWQNGMSATDARAKAVAHALDVCTGP